MDLADTVLSAHQHHKQQQSGLSNDSNNAAAKAGAGTTGAGVPDAHPTSPTSPTSHSFFHHTSTPPQSPLRKTHTNTSGTSSSHNTPRPKHRSQASFDWFGEAGAGNARDNVGRGQGRTESPGGGGTGPSNAAALRFPGGGGGGGQHRGLNKTASHDTPFADSPIEQSENEEEEGQGEDKPTQGLRGAFTAEDKMRGANALRQWSGDDSSSSAGGGGKSSKKKQRERSASMGAVEAEARGRSRSLSLNRRGGKATSVRQSGAHGGDGDEADWEDEGRDQFAEGGPVSPHPPGAARKHSMWGGAAGFLAGRGGGEHSGTSTPADARSMHDGGEDGQSSGGEQRKRPAAGQRRGSAWGVVRNKLGKASGPKAAKKKTGETLTGHELISVRSFGRDRLSSSPS